jgi:hypothetical protein
MNKAWMIAAPVAVAVLAGCSTGMSGADYDKLTAEIVKSDFQDKNLVKVDRLVQDDVMAACSAAEVAGKPRVFMPYSGGVRGYRRLLHKCADNGYEGFELRDKPLARGGHATPAAAAPSPQPSALADPPAQALAPACTIRTDFKGGLNA